MTTAPQLSVCMVTFGARDWIARSIAALVEHTTVPYELIVVDNGSDVETRQWLRDHPSIDHYIESSANSGFGGGNNLAVNHASAPLIALLNSDAIVEPGWAEQLINTLEADSGAAIVVPVLREVDGTIQEAGCSIDRDGRAEPFAHGLAEGGYLTQRPRPVSYGSAACWMLRAETYRSFGGLDCAFFPAYYEDVDFAFRVRRKGLRVVLEPRVAVTHAQGASSESSSAQSLVQHQRGRFAARHAAMLAHHSHIYDLDNEPHRFFAARDIDCATRTLHSFERPEDTQEQLAQLLDAEPWSSGIHTLCATRTTGDQLGAVADRTDIELINEPAAETVQRRLFHFSAIRASHDWFAIHDQLLRECQPQATRDIRSADVLTHSAPTYDG